MKLYFGVAVALGAQDLFKNLISGILVLVEKRFKIGDWILVDGIIGKLNNNDYLMIKGSNSTGLFKFVKNIKNRKFNAL